MAYAHRVTRVTISGGFLAGLEEWSTGFYMGSVNGDADLPSQQLADDILAAWSTFFKAATSEVSSAWSTDLVKVSSVGTDGKSNAADTVFASPGALVQGGIPGIFPPQISLVATLVSGTPRGIGAKGRMYLPGIARAIDTTGKIPGTQQNAILTNLKTFFNSVNATTATDNVVILASKGQLNAEGEPKLGGLGPVNKQVLSIRLGNVYDTQRRRRNGLTESYATQALA